MTWCQGGMLTHPFERGSFDAVVSNHRLSELVRPGGTLAIVGFARMQMRDWPWAVTSFVAVGLANRVRRKWEHTAPKTWPPPETFQPPGPPAGHLRCALTVNCLIGADGPAERELPV